MSPARLSRRYDQRHRLRQEEPRADEPVCRATAGHRQPQPVCPSPRGEPADLRQCTATGNLDFIFPARRWPSATTNNSPTASAGPSLHARLRLDAAAPE